jgi:hypothetical protein
MSRNTLGILMFVLLTAGIFAVFAIFGEKPLPKVDPAISAEQSRSKKVEPTPLEFRNTAADVHYMGDKSCENCHFNETESFRKHPMSHSVGDMAKLELKPPTEKLKHKNMVYSVERKGDKVFHVVEETDSTGKSIRRESEAIQFMGSGRRGLTFLLNNGGKLLQSPIAWYAETQKYDIAPGFTMNNDFFDRESLRNCYFCHTNHVEKEIDDEPGRMHAAVIGCERCHGPGELHLNSQEKTGNIDLSIVNPARLTPKRRDQVCYQCHLQLDVRENIEGKSIADYRPGQDLENYIRRSSNAAADPFSRFKSSSHVNQMELSTCFEKSDGKMGCVTCHNPHDWPEESKKISYYRNKCLECHTRPDPCALPAVSRLAKSPDNNCMQCHMPRKAAVDKAHTALTDHSLKRQAPE